MTQVQDTLDELNTVLDQLIQCYQDCKSELATFDIEQDDADEILEIKIRRWTEKVAEIGI